MNNYRTSRPALTLLELMLVVFILSMVAFSAVSMTNTLDQQSRFESTRDRLESLQRAVAGRPSKSVGDTLVVEGFVADMGRLPSSLNELLVPGTQPAYEVDPVSKVGRGWRGPYLSTMPTTVGTIEFRDGWGLPWKTFEIDAGSLRVQSFGSDGLADGQAGAGIGSFELDYPPPVNGVVPPLVNTFDYLVDVSNWSIEVDFLPPATGQSEATDVRLRFYYHQGAEESGKNKIESADSAETFSVPQLMSSSLPVTQAYTINVSTPVPWGVRSIAVID
ncbi:MAG: type II secretion system protein, partial [Gemmataceae bacterium]